MAAIMRRFLIAFLALLLPLTNIVLAVDIHAEFFSGDHHPELELHADNHCDPDKGGDNHPQCHHCCHAQAHFLSLPQHSNGNPLMASGHNWIQTNVTHPHPLGYAPPLPPPKT